MDHRDLSGVLQMQVDMSSNLKRHSKLSEIDETTNGGYLIEMSTEVNNTTKTH